MQMWLDENAIERHFSLTLGLPILLAMASDPMPAAELTAAELAQYSNVSATPRAMDWCRGRQALKRLLKKLGESSDCGHLDFPHPRLSLTHSGATALAAGLQAQDVGPIIGLGIDFEVAKILRAGSERFYLDEPEQTWLTGQDVKDAAIHRLRLWTVKEALFKANPFNEGTLLSSYRLTSPGKPMGTATGPATVSMAYRYAVLESNVGVIAIAVALGGRNDC